MGAAQADAVFLSPPWGGPSYQSGQGSFDVAQDIGGLGVGIAELLRVADAALHHPVLNPQQSSAEVPERSGRGVACFLPKASNLTQLSEAVPEGLLCEVERNIVSGRLKSVTVYLGPCSLVS